MFTDEQIKQYLNIGVENNMIVFDRDSKNGILTNKLIYLMDNCCINNNIGKLQYITTSLSNLPLYYKFVVLSGLEENGVYINYYKNELNGILPYDKKNLIIGITDRNNVILGSY